MAAGFTLLAIVALVTKWLPQQPDERVSGIMRVADGDSLEIGGRRIRLKGIDAPELFQTCLGGGGQIACGREAKAHLVSLIAGTKVQCAGKETDRYGRLLAVCRARGVDLNARMVRDGWAVGYGGYEREETLARKNGHGLWSFSFERPSRWRREHESDERAGIISTGTGSLDRARQALTNLMDWLTSWLE